MNETPGPQKPSKAELDHLVRLSRFRFAMQDLVQYVLEDVAQPSDRLVQALTRARQLLAGEAKRGNG